MPLKAKKPCSVPGCRMLTDSRHCSEHATVERDRRRLYDRQRSEDDWVRKMKNTSQWRNQTRPYVVMRDQGLCQAQGERPWRHPDTGELKRICGRPGTDADHIVRARDFVAQGGSFYDTSNLQLLCKSHHSRKTALEDSSFARGSGPQQIAMTEIIVVTGAPCSGKSTYVAEHRQEGDLVFDLDLIAQAITGSSERHGLWPPPVRAVAMAMRDAMLSKLRSSHDPHRAWVIASDARGITADRVVRLEVPQSVCLERAAERSPEHIRIVKDWFTGSNSLRA